MTDLSLKINDLSSWRNREEIIRQTAAQIQKDFSSFAEEVSFSGDAFTAYNELYKQVSHIVGRMLDTEYEKLFHLLYRIDVDEKTIRNVIDKETDIISPITTAILERELKKVIIRNYYSGGN